MRFYQVILILIAIAIIPTIAVLSTDDSEATVTTGQCGSNATYTLDTDSYTLTITGSGAMYDYTNSSDVPWDSSKLYIHYVFINGSVTTIGKNSFYGCNGIIEITFNSNVVSSIGERAFYGCVSLQEIQIPSTVTTIGAQAFYNCQSLGTITIPANVTSWGSYSFQECRGITEIKISEGITSIPEGAFDSCKSLTNVEMPSTLTSIGAYSFYGLETNLDITCNATTPPTIANSTVFDWTTINSIAIPQGTLTAYQTAQYWSAYSSQMNEIIYVTINFNPDGGQVTPTSKTVISGQQYGELPTPTKEYRVFMGWFTSLEGGTEVTSNTVLSQTTTQTLYAHWRVITATITLNPNGGTVSPDSVNGIIGESYGELPTPNRPGYVFAGWFNPLNVKVTAESIIESLSVNSTHLTARWRSIDADSSTYWSNGNPNGSVSILYKIVNTNLTNDLKVQYPLYEYDPTVTDNINTQFNESFVATGYYIQTEIESESTGYNNYVVTITTTLFDINDNVVAEESYEIGKWSAFIIQMDSVNGIVSYTKVMQFRSFTDYSESVGDTLLNYGSYGDFGGQVTQSIRFITDAISEVPKQSVVKTNVFLNTYGVILKDPSIDIAQYFPEMDEIRLNFYSFALYGNSMTVNGHTMAVASPNITVYYSTDSSGNHIEDAPGDGIITKSLELTNIYITWDGEYCRLTFVNDDLTINMGTYTDKEVSFDGIWYYATALYEPYQATEQSFQLDWFKSFDYSTFGLIFCGLLILGAGVVRVTIGGRALDYVIIGCAVIVALIIAGGIINA